jgi:hypothetical protein
MTKPIKPIDVTCALFRGARSRKVRATHTDTWSEFVSDRLPELLDSEATDKLRLPAFVLAPVDGVRSDETTGAHTALVIDVDALPSTRKAFLRACAAHTCVVYESPSSTDDAPRLRVIAALGRPIAPELVKAARRAFARDLGLDPAKAGVTKADAVSQIMFVGRIGGTAERRQWAFEGGVWTPPEDLEPEAPAERSESAHDGPASPPDRGADETPPIPKPLLKAIEPKAGGQRFGGRDLMRGLGGYWARKGYHPDAIESAALELPSSQPDVRAREAREAAEQFYSGDARTAGAHEVERHIRESLGEARGRTVLAALDESYAPPAWAVQWGTHTLEIVQSGASVTAWREALVSWAGLAPAGGLRKAAAQRENAAALAEVAPELDGALETDDDGRPVGTTDNTIRCVRHFLGHALAQDGTTSAAVLLERVKLDRGPGDTLEVGPWRDMYTTRMQAALNRMRMRHAYATDVRAAVAAVASERVLDVHGDWLRGLAEAWDG